MDCYNHLCYCSCSLRLVSFCNLIHYKLCRVQANTRLFRSYLRIRIFDYDFGYLNILFKGYSTVYRNYFNDLFYTKSACVIGPHTVVIVKWSTFLMGKFN